MSFEEFYEPGNGTRYHILAARIDEEWRPAGWLIAWMGNAGSGGTCIWLAEGEGYVHPSYVAEKFKVSRADAEALAKYINNKPEFKRGEHHKWQDTMQSLASE